MGSESGLVSCDGVTFTWFSDTRLRDTDIIELEITKDGHITFANISNQYCRLEGDMQMIIDVGFESY